MAQGTDEDLLMSFGEEEFVSIATGQKQLISKAPAVASVITAEQIAAMGANNLDEVLATVPGVHVSMSSTYLSEVYSIRGIHTDKNPQVLVLVNGVPITSLHFGDRGGRNRIPIRDIARVEVIRGPGSAVYGADAFAGVINIQTKNADAINGTEAGARAASFDTREFWLLHGGEKGELKYAFSAQHMSTDGDDSRRVGSDSQTVFDVVLAPFIGPLGYLPASLAPGSLETREERLDLRLQLDYGDFSLHAWHWRQDDFGVGPGLALALDPDGAADGENTLIDLSWSRDGIFPDTVLDIRAAWMDVNLETEQTLFPAGAVLPIDNDGNLNLDPLQSVPLEFTEGMIGNPEFYEEHWRFDTSILYSGIHNHQLRLAGGFNYQEETAKESKNFGPGVLDLDSREQRDPPCLPPYFLCQVDGTVTSVTGTPWIFMDDEDRTVWYLSAQDGWNLARDWELTMGLRYDHYSDFGSTVNPRVALVWETSQKLTSKFLYGRAFRAPSFAELFTINNPVALGNEDLDPETINTIEAAFDYRANFDLRTGFNLYWYEIEDQIEFVPTESGAQIAQNVGEQTGYGAELEADWQPRPDLDLHANYAWHSGEDSETDTDVALTPQHQLYLRGDWRFAAGWHLGADWRWIGERKREPGDPRQEIDDYQLVNALAGYQAMGGNLELSVQVRNLLDENAHEPSPAAEVPEGSLIPDDFALEERCFTLRLQYRFCGPDGGA
jgi:iron complex outermembrane receptor protein